MHVVWMHLAFQSEEQKVSGVGSDNDLYNITLKEYEESEEKPFPYCECAKHHEMQHFHPIINPTTLVLWTKLSFQKER